MTPLAGDLTVLKVSSERFVVLLVQCSIVETGDQINTSGILIMYVNHSTKDHTSFIVLLFFSDSCRVH